MMFSQQSSRGFWCNAGYINPPALVVTGWLYFAVDLGPEVTQHYDKAWEDILAAHQP